MHRALCSATSPFLRWRSRWFPISCWGLLSPPRFEGASVFAFATWRRPAISDHRKDCAWLTCAPARKEDRCRVSRSRECGNQSISISPLLLGCRELRPTFFLFKVQLIIGWIGIAWNKDHQQDEAEASETKVPEHLLLIGHEITSLIEKKVKSLEVQAEVADLN